MRKINKSRSLFTYENDHYMGIDMKWMDRVCKYCIRYPNNNKEKILYTANICCSTYIDEIQRHNGINIVSSPLSQHIINNATGGSQPMPIELAISSSKISLPRSLSYADPNIYEQYRHKCNN